MKSIRLTNAKRDYILDQEETKKFYDKEKLLKDELLASINKSLQKDLPKWITPEIEESGYLKKHGTFSLRTPMDWVDRASSLLKEHHVRSKIKTTPHSDWSALLNYSKTVENKALKYQALLDEQKKFWRDLSKVLNSFTNSKSLLEHVPELKGYFKDEMTSVALIPLEDIKAIRKELVKSNKKTTVKE